MGRPRPSTISPEALAMIAALGVLVAVGAAQAGDLLTFVRMVGASGVGAELNPVVARGAATMGLLPLALVKVALVVLVVASFAVVARSHRRTAAVVATAGTVAGLAGAFSNLFALG